MYLAGAVLLPLIGGVLLDNVLHTEPVFVLIGLVVGLGAVGVANWWAGGEVCEGGGACGCVRDAG